MSYGHAEFLLQKPAWLTAAWAEVHNDQKESEAMSTKTKKSNPRNLPGLVSGNFTDDDLSKQFYEKRDQSACNLAPGDLIYHGDVLVAVKEVKNSKENGRMVTLSDGYVFSPTWHGKPHDEWKMHVTFWRPRPGFSGFGL